MCLPQDEPSVEPQRRAHPPMVPRLEQHPAQSGVIVFASHKLTAGSWQNTNDFLRPNSPCVSIRRSKEYVLPRTREVRSL